MGDHDRREIFERLERLERMAHWGGDRGGREHRHGRDRDHGRRDGSGDRGGDDFEEKRIIDTIVRLVTENVGRMLQDREAQARGTSRDGGDGGDEKRIVDLIVACVSEHVQEIVATELDRRLGPPRERTGGRSAGAPDAEER